MTAEQHARWNNVVYQLNRACQDGDFLSLFTQPEAAALLAAYDACKRIMRDEQKPAR